MYLVRTTMYTCIHFIVYLCNAYVGIETEIEKREQHHGTHGTELLIGWINGWNNRMPTGIYWKWHLQTSGPGEHNPHVVMHICRAIHLQYKLMETLNIPPSICDSQYCRSMYKHSRFFLVNLQGMEHIEQKQSIWIEFCDFDAPYHTDIAK